MKAKSSRRNSSSNTGQWSGGVTRRSHALDLEPGIFAAKDPRRIALSLKRSAESSNRRKGTPFQSAMSMLSFYINRAGSALALEQKIILERAKVELRRAFRQKVAAPTPAAETLR